MTVYTSRSLTFSMNSAGAVGNAIDKLIKTSTNPSVTTLVDSGCVIIGSGQEFHAWITYS